MLLPCTGTRTGHAGPPAADGLPWSRHQHGQSLRHCVKSQCSVADRSWGSFPQKTGVMPSLL